MGLDLVCECGSHDMKVGSYSNVHRIRIGWILAEALAQQDETHAKAMRSSILTDSDIDYHIFVNTSGWLPGTHAFIDHSDCDGIWDTQQIRCIMEAIHLLRPFLQKTLPHYFHENTFYLENILNHCIHKNESIHFV